MQMLLETLVIVLSQCLDVSSAGQTELSADDTDQIFLFFLMSFFFTFVL